ncbi:Calcyclin-binding protein [Dissostichus eleginoides]|uniref:Calcyclin-binding protein n=1 Tax=Dissostichus eleginoides TaxID=100907 RepID=A0AAD9EYP1_DISEL|nr:Calcyclin-binding protein [Dissostichus eleginoides]
MAAHRIACLGLNALYSSVCAPKQALRNCWGTVEQVRGYYVNWRMLRDVKRRQMAFDFADERLRINALRKNTILPKELQINQLEADLVELGSLLEKAQRKRVQELLQQEQKKVEKELAVKRQQKEKQDKKEADPTAASKAAYTVKITNYAWDQSDKFVKIYLTMKDLHKIPPENVEVSFTESKPNVEANADPSDGLMTMLKKIYSDGDDEMKRTINKAWSESQEKKVRGGGGEDMMDF